MSRKVVRFLKKCNKNLYVAQHIFDFSTFSVSKVKDFVNNLRIRHRMTNFGISFAIWLLNSIF